MAASEDDKASKWKTLMPTFDCHFKWCKLKEEGKEDKRIIASAFTAVHFYNSARARPVRRFAMCLHAAYVAFYTGKDAKACEKLLLTAYRVLEHCRDPESPPPPSKLPKNPFCDLTWGLPDDQFFAECEKLTGEQCDVEPRPDSSSDDGSYAPYLEESDEDGVDEDEGTLPLWNEDRFTGMYEGARHVVDSLKVMMLFSDPLRGKFENTPTSITPFSQLTASDRALIRYVEAWSWLMLQSNNNYVKALRGVVLADPSDVKWYLFLLGGLAEVRCDRHLEWGRKVEWEDVLDFLEVIDSVHDQSPPPWMVLELNFERLQAINDYMVSFRRTMPHEEAQKLYHICSNLCKKIIENTSHPDYLAYCAQFLSRRPQTMDLAVSTIEKALAVDVTGKNPHYINAKACNIYLKVERYEDALACAESAATEAFGSNWQILEVKTLMGHEINPKEFFEVVRKRCQLTVHVEQLHVNAYLYYICKTKDINEAVFHIERVVQLASIKSKIMGDMFCKWINEDVNLVEAFYMTAMYVLNGDYKDDEIELSDKAIETCSKLKDTIEADHLKNRELPRLTPKEYVRWLRSPRKRKHVQRGGGEDEGQSSFLPHQKYVETQFWSHERSHQSITARGRGRNYRGTRYSNDGSTDFTFRRVSENEGSSNTKGGYGERGNAKRGYSGRGNFDRGNADRGYSWRGNTNEDSGYAGGIDNYSNRGARSTYGDAGYSYRRNHNFNTDTSRTRPEKLSWRSEMRPTKPSESHPGSSSESKPWQGRTAENATSQDRHSQDTNPHENGRTTRDGPHHNWRNRSE